MSGLLRAIISFPKVVISGVHSIAKDKREFIEKMKRLEDIAEQYGIQRGIITAQIALETNYGKKVIGNNLFNIKATESWIKAGKPVQEVWTWEVIGGKVQRVKAKFRDYNSFEESLMDYIRLISLSNRYVLAWANRCWYKKYYQELYKGGYATDSRYSNKLIDTFEELGFA